MNTKILRIADAPQGSSTGTPAPAGQNLDPNASGTGDILGTNTTGTPGVTPADGPPGGGVQGEPAGLPVPPGWVAPPLPTTSFQNADGKTIEQIHAEEIDALAEHFAQVERDAAAAAADRAGAGELLDAAAPAEAALALVFGPVPLYRRMVAGIIFASASLKAEKEKLITEGDIPTARQYGLRAAKLDAALPELRKCEAGLIQNAGSLQ